MHYINPWVGLALEWFILKRQCSEKGRKQVQTASYKISLMDVKSTALEM